MVVYLNSFFILSQELLLLSIFMVFQNCLFCYACAVASTLTHTLDLYTQFLSSHCTHVVFSSTFFFFTMILLKWLVQSLFFTSTWPNKKKSFKIMLFLLKVLFYFILFFDSSIHSWKQGRLSYCILICEVMVTQYRRGFPRCYFA